MDDYNVPKQVHEKISRAIHLANKITKYTRDLLRKELDDITFEGEDDYHRLFSIIVSNIILCPVEEGLNQEERNDFISGMMSEINRFIKLHEEMRIKEPTMH